MPALSILLPVYNGASYIKEAVESVLAQTFADFVLHVLDDGSTDDTLVILTEFTDSRLQVYKNNENKKLIYTLNKGLALSIAGNYKYIVRMDADDICLPQRIEKLVAFMDANPEVGLCGSWVEEFNQDGTIKISRRSADNEKIRAELFFQNTIWHPSVIIRTVVVKENNLRFEQEFLHAEDYALWCRMMQVTKLANLQEVLLRYRVHETNISVKNGSLQRSTTMKINLINLNYYLLTNNLINTENDKEKLRQLFIGLLEKIPADADTITKDELLSLQKLLWLNGKTKAFNEDYFQQELSGFMLHYWSLWCPKYSLKTFTLLFVYGRFFSKHWSQKQQLVAAGKCFAGWRARR